MLHGSAVCVENYAKKTFHYTHPHSHPQTHKQPLPLWQKAAAGLTAGGLGALVGSPADLTLIRMQADSTLPPDQRRNYKGVVDAMARTVKEDGVVGLFRGGGPTVVRAMALNMGMLASNDQVCGVVWVGGILFYNAPGSSTFVYVQCNMRCMQGLPRSKNPLTTHPQGQGDD